MESKKLYGAAAAAKANKPLEDPQVKVLREFMWRGLGLTPEGLGERLRLALDRATDLLEAMDTKYFSHEGVVTDERLIEAHKAQLKAIHEITNIVRTLLPKHETPKQGPVDVNVVVPWRQ